MCLSSKQKQQKPDRYPIINTFCLAIPTGIGLGQFDGLKRWYQWLYILKLVSMYILIQPVG